jgi:SpoIID/LytB domain protein
MKASSFASRVETVYGIDLYDYSDDPADWLEIESYTSGGYVGTVSLGGRTKGVSGSSYGNKTITGRSIRETLLNYQIRSHCFEYEYDEESDYVIFTTYGYGHGVGMSQYGAQMMALEGYDYEEILTHYYTGVVVK